MEIVMHLWEIARNGLRQPAIALLLCSLVVGTFFTISGFHKLFSASRHAQLVKTLKDCGVPLLWFNQWFVPLVEFLGGIAVMTGVLAPLAALGMLVILAVAIWTAGRAQVGTYNPLNAFDRVCCYLYLPETLLASLLLMSIVAGPGKYTLYGAVVGLGFPDILSFVR